MIDEAAAGVRRHLNPGNWRPWARRVAYRYALVGAAFAFWALYLAYALSDPSPLGGGAQSGAPESMYQGAPGITRSLFVLAAVALLVEAGSVTWRAVRRSNRPGYTGMVVGVMGALLSLVGILTIGLFVVPFTVWCIVLALPIDLRPSPPGRLPPEGWYADPTGWSQWRWWDGSAWTGWVAPVTAMRST